MKSNLPEVAIVSILLIIALIAASAGSKALTTTAQELLNKALEVSEPRR